PRCGACIGDRLADHRWVWLGRMPVSGLQRDEPRVDVMPLKAMFQPPVRLSGRDREEPALFLQRIEKREHAIEQGFLDLPGRAQRPEGTLVFLRQPPML